MAAIAYTRAVALNRGIDMRCHLAVALLTSVLLTACAGTTPATRKATTASASCTPIDQAGAAALFEEWNRAVESGNPDAVVALYAPHSLLLPTVSKQPRLSAVDKRDYFVHFLHDAPSGSIDQRFVDIGCDSVVDAGLYTFRFARTGAVVPARYSYTWKPVGGRWLITSHHSSVLPPQ